MNEKTPKQIVSELDKYIVGQFQAKKSVAIALRNRWRSKRLATELKDDVIPKNILMIGSTGVGKTEIARRIAKLVQAPFIKVEATKFTEVGYIGRDVESIIRDLAEKAIQIVKSNHLQKVESDAKIIVDEKILDCFMEEQGENKNQFELLFNNLENNEPKELSISAEAAAVIEQEKLQKKAELRNKLLNQELEDELIEVYVEDNKGPMVGMIAGAGLEEIGSNIQDMLGNLLPKKQKKKKITVKNARKIFMQEEAQKMIDMDNVINEGLDLAQNNGIVFIDEIDKIAGRNNSSGPDVSREGVQRDILPIVEGTTVNTKYGAVKTDHILFIAAGAFHISKPSELIPELQGRFPIRVELTNLSEADFKQILTEPANSLIKQYQAMLMAENVKITFKLEAIEELAKMAHKVNEQMENIGARRLHTMLEKLLEDLSFEAPELSGTTVIIDQQYVKDKLGHIIIDEDLSRFIL
ncbi:MAG: ATP-dependent protease ATPase subunit HslU [Negativicutes bacterium]|nr:ATP-dependent protease ATPase subunit HslU [Negativicutes bacterium]MBP9949451.1 ATP-dependent protease ATPase subunit HslU [Negativicutes bacterium]